MNITEWLNQVDQYQRIPDMDAKCQGDIAGLARIVKAAHAAGFVTDEGEVRAVVGKLEYTEAGSIVSRGGIVWFHQPLGDQVLVRALHSSGIGHKIWDTREAAEASAAERSGLPWSRRGPWC